MSYDYQHCFWDPNDEGVNVLLAHISSGIKSTNTVINFFKLKSELEKDYARRLGAACDRFSKDMEVQPEFGKLNDIFQKLLTYEKSKAQSHSKQSELIYRQMYSDTKAFHGELKARYSTMSGKIEKLRLDKYNKKVGCKDLNKKLEEAQMKTRGLELNQYNTIGARKSEQNQRELQKWKSNAQEVGNQLNVLKQEYKASQKFWIEEWSELAYQFQKMETTRISFIQTKLSDYAQATIETSLVEQSRMDLLSNQLATFTPHDDIERFASEYGTGRLKEKTKTQSESTVSRNMSSSSSKRHSYMENIRKLSSQLQETQKRHSMAHTQPIGTIENPVYIEDGLNSTATDRRKVASPSLSSSSASSSNPTDFTAHVKNRSSMDSMTTSVSSMASYIGDSQRFAKSWNSANRRRKSLSHTQLPSPEGSDDEHIPSMRKSSTNTTIVNTPTSNGNVSHSRRKSMVTLNNSTNAIEDALYEMDRIQSVSTNGFAHSDHKVGRFRDNGITVTLPLVTNGGETVKKYAKALYPLLDNNAPGLAHFNKNDYLLITEKVNDEWYRGEVYGNDVVGDDHKTGLIPYNFIQFLS